jgi:hypothetical protein
VLLRWLFVGVLLAGCGPSDDPLPGDTCELGAGTAIVPVFAEPLGAVHDVEDEGSVPLVSAPQGGYILLVGARAELGSGTRCQVTLNAALRDPRNGRVVGLEQRPVPLYGRPDGWAWPPDPSSLSDLANVAVCPTFTASTDIFDNPFQLEIKLLDENEAVLVEATRTIVPTCGSTFCRAECALAQ